MLADGETKVLFDEPSRRAGTSASWSSRRRAPWSTGRSPDGLLERP
jgi:hypothetical protein